MNTPFKTRPRPLRRALALLLVLPLAAGPAWAQSFIGTLQGTSHISPYNNQSVSNIAGIVTARDTNGFWIQDGGDGNALTSDAIYVFNSTAAKPLVGDSVLVGGRVLEFRPGSDATNLTITEINATSAFGGSWSTLSSGNALPAAIQIGPGFLPPTAIAPVVGNIESAPGYVLQPQLYSLDFYESMEGMRVSMASAISSGPTNTGTGETTFYASAQSGAVGTFTSPRGGLVIAAGQFNGHRLIVDNRISASPVVNSGAWVSGLTGVLDYSFNNYKLLLTEPATVVSNSLAREIATIAPGRFGMASYNVENLGGNAAASRFTAIAGQIAGTLGAPHLISLQEIQDDNGATKVIRRSGENIRATSKWSNARLVGFANFADICCDNGTRNSSKYYDPFDIPVTDIDACYRKESESEACKNPSCNGEYSSIYEHFSIIFEIVYSCR